MCGFVCARDYGHGYHRDSLKRSGNRRIDGNVRREMNYLYYWEHLGKDGNDCDVRV